MSIMTSDNVSLNTSNFGDRLPAYVAGGKWQPTRTGNYAVDCHHGHELANDIVSRVNREGTPLHLGMVARAIVESGQWEAVEIGLFSRLGMILS